MVRRIFGGFGVAIFLLTFSALEAQIQVRARYEGEWLPINTCDEGEIVVLKDGKKLDTPRGELDIRPATTFATGFITTSNIRADLDPLKDASPTERARPDATRFRYEADIVSDIDLEDCCAVVTFVNDGSIGTHLFSVGNLYAKHSKHLKLELHSRITAVGRLHVFSKTIEIRSTQNSAAYDVHEYFAALLGETRGIPAVQLCKLEETYSMALSRDGRLLAMSQDRDSHYAVIVFELDTMKVICEVPASEHHEPIRDITWFSERELAFILGEKQDETSFKGGKLKVLNIDKGKCEQVEDHVERILGSVYKHPEILTLLGRNKYHQAWPVQFDARTHKPLNTTSLEYGWTKFDPEGRERINYNYDEKSKKYQCKVRPDGPWVDLDSTVKQPGLKFSLRGKEILNRVADVHSVGPDGDTLYISSRLGSDTFQLCAYSLSEGVIKQVIAKSPKYDLTTADFGISRILFRRSTSAVIGMVYEGEKPRVLWFDLNFAAVQKTVDQVLPNHFNYPVDWADDASAFIYFSSSDQDPGTYYAFRPQEGKLVTLLSLSERLKGKKLGRTVPLNFAARDGVEIHGYVTSPPEAPRGLAPLVVIIHGGPMARDGWRFDAMNQFLATRGYVVLQVNFRGSSGYGAAYQNAGLMAQLDTVTIDDVADGVQHLLKAGGIDPARVVVAGGSFGGWATYMSLIRYPDLYKAGIAIAAVSDFRMQKYDYHGSYGGDFWKMILDVPANEKMIDPIRRTAEIKQPLFIMHGEIDPVVNVEQARKMLSAVKQSNREVESMGFPTATHSYWPLDTRVTYLNEIDSFIRRHLPAAGATN